MKNRLMMLLVFGITSGAMASAQVKHDPVLVKVDQGVRQMVRVLKLKLSNAFDHEYEHSIRAALSVDATQGEIYKAILLLNFREWMTQGMGIPQTPLLLQLKSAFDKFGSKPSYESRKVQVLCCREYWLTPEAAKIAQ